VVAFGLIGTCPRIIEDVMRISHRAIVAGFALILAAAFAVSASSARAAERMFRRSESGSSRSSREPGSYGSSACRRGSNSSAQNVAFVGHTTARSHGFAGSGWITIDKSNASQYRF
jgi:hypothetical protein